MTMSAKMSSICLLAGTNCVDGFGVVAADKVGGLIEVATAAVVKKASAAVGCLTVGAAAVEVDVVRNASRSANGSLDLVFGAITGAAAEVDEEAGLVDDGLAGFGRRCGTGMSSSIGCSSTCTTSCSTRGGGGRLETAAAVTGAPAEIVLADLADVALPCCDNVKRSSELLLLEQDSPAVRMLTCLSKKSSASTGGGVTDG